MTDPDESKAKMTWNLVRFGKQDAKKGILVFQIYSSFCILQTLKGMTAESATCILYMHTFQHSVLISQIELQHFDEF